MTIALLCPTRKRPEQFRRMIRSAFETANPKSVKIYAAFSKEEWDEYAYCADDCWVSIMPDGMPTAHKWNALAEIAMKDKSNTHFMLASDDMVFTTPLWNEALLAAYTNTPHVYHLRDSRDEFGTPHPIVTREYIEAMGFFLPPFFMHWYVDSWTVEIAKHNNCFTHLKDYMLEHIKPSDAGKPDETHTGIRARGWHDRDKWVDEHCKDILEMYKRRIKC